VQLASLIAAYLLAVYLCFRTVQLRIWNDMGAVDVLTMAGLILPFMVMPWVARPRLRVTRYAWGASVVMALDVVCFASSVFGPLGSGHPSLESLVSYFLALAKPILVPVVLALLCIACVKGERMVVVAAGFLCAAGETLYATYPTGWWGTA
jgi:branched-subunit amino acid transport protein AzlD